MLGDLLLFRERYFGWLARGGWGTMPPAGEASGVLCAGDLNYLKRSGVTQHPGEFTSKHSQMGRIQFLGWRCLGRGVRDVFADSEPSSWRGGLDSARRSSSARVASRRACRSPRPVTACICT